MFYPLYAIGGFPFSLEQLTWGCALHIFRDHRFKFPNEIVIPSLQIVCVVAISIFTVCLSTHLGVTSNKEIENSSLSL